MTAGEYQRANYKIRKVRVDDVFNFLRVVRPLLRESSIKFPKQGDLFQVKEAEDAAKALTGFLKNSASQNESPFAVTIVANYIENCAPSGGAGELDLVYRTVTTAIPLATGLTLESRTEQQTDPPQSIGATSNAKKVRIVPQLSYNLADHLQYGVRVRASAHSNIGLFDSFEMIALHSSSSRFTSAALSGARTNENNAFAKAQWRFSWTDSKQPTDVQHIELRKLAFQGSAQTRPFGRIGAVLRLGASFEGGNQRNDSSVVDNKSPAATGYGAVRSYVGMTFNTKGHVWAGSYGLLLGRLPGGNTVDYRKHLVDLAYSLHYNGFDHRPLEIESRFTAGVLQTVRAAPAAERFYGGTEALSFIEGDAWDFRANPVIRSIPKNYLNRISGQPGSGGESFVSLNVTASIPVWRYPLIPSSISRLPDFRSGLNGAKETGLQQAIVYYRSKDPAQKEAAEQVAEVESSFAGLLKHLREIEPMFQGDLTEKGADCIDALDAAPDMITAAAKQTGFGPVESFIIPQVLTACRDELNVGLRDPMIDSESRRLEALRLEIRAKVDKVDQNVAEAKAHEDLDYAFRAFDMFVDDVNVLAVSPVGIFDAARIGPGYRYGVGVGGRVTIMNAINLTAGYAWNPSPRSWEKRGALFVSFRIIDLLR